MARIGLFGGTFNPIHNGHLRAALEVKEGFPLDRCVLIPAALPPHKASAHIVKASDRLEMIRLALENQAGLDISDIELKRSGPSYTIDTVAHFSSQSLEKTEPYLIIGFDAFMELDTWKSYQQLLQAVPFIVLTRPTVGPNGWVAQKRLIQRFLEANISTDYKWDDQKRCFFHGVWQSIFFHAVTALDISSSHIRQMLRNGYSIRFLVPDKVIEHIRKKGLYR